MCKLGEWTGKNTNQLNTLNPMDPEIVEEAIQAAIESMEETPFEMV